MFVRKPQNHRRLSALMEVNSKQLSWKVCGLWILFQFFLLKYLFGSASLLFISSRLFFIFNPSCSYPKRQRCTSLYKSTEVWRIGYHRWPGPHNQAALTASWQSLEYHPCDQPGGFPTLCATLRCIYKVKGICGVFLLVRIRSGKCKCVHKVYKLFNFNFSFVLLELVP